MVFSLLRQRSVQIILSITLYLLLAAHLPIEAHQGLYTISLFIKDLLLWVLPVTVGFFIAHAICSFESKAPLFILVLFLFEALSNFASVCYAFGSGHLAATFLPAVDTATFQESFAPLWRLPLEKPQWWSADKGTIVGIILGLIAAFRFPLVRQFIARGKQGVERILTQFFARLIPLFVLGFVARMYQGSLLKQMVSQYTVLLWLVAILVVYILALFALGSKGTLKTRIRNLLPAGALAFSSGCSLSTMPLTIEGAAKNLDNPDLAKAVIPATTNIQQIGDCITNAFLCFLIYCQFNGHPPPFADWMLFSVVFVLARFATAAVLGGAIFIMLPIYENYLSFTPEMIALILAFNVLLDPIVTCCNVLANGALCSLFERVWNLIVKKPVATENV